MKIAATVLAFATILAACGTGPQAVDSPPTVSGRTPLGSVMVPPPPPTAIGLNGADGGGAPSPSPFAELVNTLSEPNGPFFSDNIISNETSYLAIGTTLDRHAPRGAVYIGVGPEQNFTYIALTRPAVAFIVDIRRQNMIEHLLYRALFTEATSRAHFVALLLGRPFDANRDPGASATIEEVLAAATAGAPTEASFAEIHRRLQAAVTKEMPLDAEDKKNLEIIHRAFHTRQLELRFELKPPSGRRYPTLREIFSQKDSEGRARGFLAEEEAFRFVQRLEREGKVIPVVGDFAGDRALPGIAAYLRREKLALGAFYTSNVEQYLLEPATWARWVRNVDALPRTRESVFVRAYLDQGRRHPKQAKGHRTVSLVQRMDDFDERFATKRAVTFWDLCAAPTIDAEG